MALTPAQKRKFKRLLNFYIAGLGYFIFILLRFNNSPITYVPLFVFASQATVFGVKLYKGGVSLKELAWEVVIGLLFGLVAIVIVSALVGNSLD